MFWFQHHTGQTVSNRYKDIDIVKYSESFGFSITRVIQPVILEVSASSCEIKLFHHKESL